MVYFTSFLLAVSGISFAHGLLVPMPTEISPEDNIAITSPTPTTIGSSPPATPAAPVVSVTVTATPTITTLLTIMVTTVSVRPIPAPTCTTTIKLQPQRPRGKKTTVYKSTTTVTDLWHCGGCSLTFEVLPYTVSEHSYKKTKTKSISTMHEPVCSTNKDGSIYNGPREYTPHIIEPDAAYTSWKNAGHTKINWWPWGHQR